MQEYVLGFAFSTIGELVVLIEKNKPAWMKGLLKWDWRKGRER